MIIKSFTQLHNALKLFQCSYDEYSKHWLTLHYIWTVHKCGIMVICTKGSLNMYAFANDRFDNRLSWPSQDISFELDGILMKDHVEYYAEKKRKH